MAIRISLMSKNDPAFPQPVPRIASEHGLTKRDWFAGMALEIGYTLAAIKTSASCPKPECIAEAAYRIADAMLESQSDAEENNHGVSSE